MAPQVKDRPQAPSRLSMEPMDVIQAYASLDPSIGPEFAPVSGFDCTGGSVEARRVSRGRYEVRWEGIQLDSAQAAAGAHATPATRKLTPLATASDANDLVITLIDPSGTQNDEAFSVSYVAASA